MRVVFVLLLFLFGISSEAQIITTFAGNGITTSITGDGGPATAGSINGANGGAFDKSGNYYVCDNLGHRLRMVTPSGIISTVAGNGSSGYLGDGGPATAAKLRNPASVAIDSHDNLYINDLSNYVIRKVSASTGIISTFAGTGVSGYNGDNIPATDAQLGGVQDISFDTAGNLYLVDQVNFRVRKINTSGIISTIAGSGGFSSLGTGDGGAATAATFNFLSSVVVDKAGNVFVSDLSAAKIRRISTSGIITTIAGNGIYTYSGDNIPATDAQFAPLRFGFDRTENIVIGDKVNERVYRIDDAGIFHCIVGTGITGYGGDGGPATAATLNYPAGIVYDTCGNLYIAESTGRRVRKVAFNPLCWPISVRDVSATQVAVMIFPDPATTTLVIAGTEKIDKIAVLNIAGQMIMDESYTNKQTVTLDVKHLQPGMYLLRINDIIVKRFVKE
jgi:trimeric autotransporter adhesin